MTAIKYRYEDVEGLKVFYREAGHADDQAVGAGEERQQHQVDHAFLADDELPQLRGDLVARDLEAIGVGEVRFRGDITPTTKMVRYEVNIRQARRGRQQGLQERLQISFLQRFLQGRRLTAC